MAFKEKMQKLSKYSIVPCFLAMEVFAFLGFSFSGNYLFYGILSFALFIILLIFSLFEIKRDEFLDVAFLLFPLIIFSLLTALSYYSTNHIYLGDFNSAEIAFIPIGLISIGFSGYLISLNKDFKIKIFLIVVYSAIAALVLLNLLTTLINFGAFHTLIYKDSYMYYGGLRSSTSVSNMAYTLEGFKFIEVSIAHYTLYPALLLSSSTSLLYLSFKNEKKTYILFICFAVLAILSLILVPSIEGLFAVLIIILINLYLFLVKRFKKVKKIINIVLIVILALGLLGLFFLILNYSSTPNFINKLTANNAFLNRLFNTNGFMIKYSKTIRDIFKPNYFLGFSHYFVTDFYMEEVHLTGSYLFDSFMTSGVMGANGLFVLIIAGIVNFNGYMKKEDDEDSYKRILLSFVLMFYLYSLLYGDGEYAIYYHVYKPIYMSGPFLLTIFIFFYVCAKKVIKKPKEIINTEENEQYEAI